MIHPTEAGGHEHVRGRSVRLPHVIQHPLTCLMVL